MTSLLLTTWNLRKAKNLHSGTRINTMAIERLRYVKIYKSR